VRWKRLLILFAWFAAPLLLASCGKSSNTTVSPTITVSCTPVDVTLLSTSQCTATVLNLSSTLVNWSVSGTGTGSITAGGLYTAPAAIPGNNQNVVTITATSQAQSTLTATQNLTLIQPTAINAVTCNTPQGAAATKVASGDQLVCTATSSTGATVPVNWTVSSALGGDIGSISAQGSYTAPLVPPPGQIVTIAATSKALASETMSVTITVVFGPKVLSGPYAFSLSGRLPTHAFWARVGSFTAGGGALTGIEDTNQGGTPNTVTTQRTFTGSYTIGDDGRGAMQFCEDTSSACPLGQPATAYFRIAMVSPQQAQIIEFSAPGGTAATTIAGGQFLSQSALNFGAGNGNLSGTYSFNFFGVSSTAAQESIVGEFAANGFGSVSAGGSSSPGEMDIDAVGPAFLSATTYSISSNGRGTLTLGGLTFSFYPVSSSRALFIEIDPVPPSATQSSILLGDAYKQQTSSTCGWSLNALNGTTVFQTFGDSSGVAIADVGDFIAANDGTTGSIGGASVDENNGGAVTSTLGTLGGNYTMSSCGRGTLTIGAHSYVFYIISPSDAVLQEVTSGVVASGFLLPSQGGAFADATLTGSYAFRMGGTDAPGAAGHRQDFLGQFTSAGSGTGVAGTLDLNDFGVTQTGVAITNGTYLPVPSGSLRGTMSLPLNTAPASTLNLVLYMVSPKLFYVLETDPTGMAVGVINNQF
jgi:hypothetical protein